MDIVLNGCRFAQRTIDLAPVYVGGNRRTCEQERETKETDSESKLRIVNFLLAYSFR
jgi:hypothetical protein